MKAAMTNNGFPKLFSLPKICFCITIEDLSLWKQEVVCFRWAIMCCYDVIINIDGLIEAGPKAHSVQGLQRSGHTSNSL